MMSVSKSIILQNIEKRIELLSNEFIKITEEIGCGVSLSTSIVNGKPYVSLFVHTDDDSLISRMSDKEGLRENLQGFLFDTPKKVEKNNNEKETVYD